MDPATATAGAYGLETAIEAGVAAYYLTTPTLPLKAQLQHLASPSSLARSSHSLAVVGDRAYIFGGHLQDQKSSTNDTEELHISTTDTDSITTSLKTVTAIGENGDVPQTRIHHTATIARNRIFVFGGCDISSSEALAENGRLWVFDPLESNWLFLDPPPHTSFPAARYQHSSTAAEDGSAIFIHGGMGSDGSRLADTWAFYLDEGKWTRLSDTPGKARSGASIVCCKGRLWRFGDFDGESVVDGLEVYELPGSQSIEHPGVLDVSKREWEIVSPETSKEGESTAWPAARSMAAMHHITTGNGRDYLVLALGEGDPASKTGRLLQDIWAYQLPSSGISGANVKDTIRDKVPGVKTHEGQWAPVEVTKMEVGEDEKLGGAWTGRSFFGSSVTGTKQFLLWGGVDGHGEALGDGWWVKIE